MSEALVHSAPGAPIHGTVEEDSAAPLYGLMAEFDTPEAVLEAAQKAHAAGYQCMDAYTPMPVEGLSDALGHRDTLIPYTMLAGGILGAIGGFGLLYYCMVLAYPLNVGGQPLFAWPIYIPITFECTVLLAALSGVFGMFIYNQL